jgi:hypothetical protein
MNSPLPNENDKEELLRAKLYYENSYAEGFAKLNYGEEKNSFTQRRKGKA